jgi:hypothetical protein
VTGTLQEAGDWEKSLVIVHGTTPKANRLTLQNCVLSGGARDATEMYRTRYDVELVITGEHFANANSILFSELNVSYSTLIQWIGKGIFKLEKDRNHLDMVIKILPPLTLKLHETAEVSLSLVYLSSWTFSGGYRELQVQPKAFIAIRWTKPCLVTDTLALARNLRDFLTFAMGQPTNIDRISAPRQYPSSLIDRSEVTVFHRSLFSPKLAGETFSFPFFTLSDVSADIVHVLDLWFVKGDILQAVIDLHLSHIYNPQMKPENQFLTAVQALEAFHRRTRSNVEICDKEHEKRIAKVLATAPVQYRKWLETRLQYSNEPGLRFRTKSLFNEFRDILSYFALDLRSFTEAVNVTRSYLTHYDRYSEPAAAKGEDLQRLAHQLQLLLDVSLLNELGIPKNVVAKLARRRYFFLTKTKKQAEPNDSSTSERKPTIPPTQEHL